MYRDERLRQVGQIDRHHVTAPDSQFLQGVGASCHLVAQHAVGERADGAVLAFPDHGRAISTRRVFGMTIDAVVGDVERAALEITHIGQAAGAHGVPRLGPAELAGRPHPVLVDPGGLGLACLRQQGLLPRRLPPRG